MWSSSSMLGRNNRKVMFIQLLLLLLLFLVVVKQNACQYCYKKMLLKPCFCCCSLQLKLTSRSVSASSWMNPSLKLYPKCKFCMVCTLCCIPFPPRESWKVNLVDREWIRISPERLCFARSPPPDQHIRISYQMENCPLIISWLPNVFWNLEPCRSNAETVSSTWRDNR